MNHSDDHIQGENTLDDPPIQMTIELHYPGDTCTRKGRIETIPSTCSILRRYIFGYGGLLPLPVSEMKKISLWYRDYEDDWTLLESQLDLNRALDHAVFLPKENTICLKLRAKFLHTPEVVVVWHTETNDKHRKSCVKEANLKHRQRRSGVCIKSLKGLQLCSLQKILKTAKHRAFPDELNDTSTSLPTHQNRVEYHDIQTPGSPDSIDGTVCSPFRTNSTIDENIGTNIGTNIDTKQPESLDDIENIVSNLWLRLQVNDMCTLPLLSKTLENNSFNQNLTNEQNEILYNETKDFEAKNHNNNNNNNKQNEGNFSTDKCMSPSGLQNELNTETIRKKQEEQLFKKIASISKKIDFVNEKFMTSISIQQ